MHKIVIWNGLLLRRLDLCKRSKPRHGDRDSKDENESIKECDPKISLFRMPRITDSSGSNLMQ